MWDGIRIYCLPKGGVPLKKGAIYRVRSGGTHSDMENLG